MFIVFALVLCIIIAIIPHALFLLGTLISLPFHYHLPYRPFGCTAVVLVVGCFLLLLYGNQIGRFQHEVKRISFYNASIPDSFNGYKIVQISDLHLDSWTHNPKQLKKRIAEINALNPDLICFTGDLISLSSKEIEPHVDILRGLKAKDGIISVLGNHDYVPYSPISDEEREQEIAHIIHYERELLGWNLLLNERTTISRGSDSILFVGCENQSVGAHSTICRGDLSKAIGNPSHLFSILLTHDPSQWRKEVVGKTAIPLTLSGHTHAMQFRIFGWTPSRWLFPECEGLYTEGNQSLYVNIGLGGTAPFRLGAKPEITEITLSNKK